MENRQNPQPQMSNENPSYEIGVWDPSAHVNINSSHASSSVSASDSEYAYYGSQYQQPNMYSNPGANPTPWTNPGMTTDHGQLPVHEYTMPVYNQNTNMLNQYASGQLPQTNHNTPAAQYGQTFPPQRQDEGFLNTNKQIPSHTTQDSWQNGSGFDYDGDIRKEGLSSYSVTSFKNPLLEDEDSSNPEKLIQQLHLQDDKAKMSATNPQPSFLSKSALAVLRQDLSDAGLAFKSAANLKIARDAHLGFDVTDDISTNVVVSNLSVNAVEFIPKARDVPKLKDVDVFFNKLSEFISKVLEEPGEFDIMSARLIDDVKRYNLSEEDIKRIVKMLFEKAIEEDNFKYLGAKLCQQLTSPDVLPAFRSHFLTHLQAKYKDVLKLVESHDDDINTIHGFCMFLAEVFIHLKINGTPFKALGRSFSNMLHSLLNDGRLSHIQFVCKVMKLTGGFFLDAFEDSDVDMNHFNENFSVLERYHKENEKNTEMEKIVLAIKSLLRLKEGNWGRKTSTSDGESTGGPTTRGRLSQSDENYYMNEPVFFTSDGVPYTLADTQLPEFHDQPSSAYQTHLYEQIDNQQTWSTTEETDELVPSDDEYDLHSRNWYNDDEEYNKEFEQFLKESGQL